MFPWYQTGRNTSVSVQFHARHMFGAVMCVELRLHVWVPSSPSCTQWQLVQRLFLSWLRPIPILVTLTVVGAVCRKLCRTCALVRIARKRITFNSLEMSLHLLFMLLPPIAVFNVPHASLTKTPDDQFIMWWHRSLQRHRHFLTLLIVRRVGWCARLTNWRRSAMVEINHGRMWRESGTSVVSTLNRRFWDRIESLTVLALVGFLSAVRSEQI